MQMFSRPSWARLQIEITDNNPYISVVIPRKAVGEMIPVLLATNIAIPVS